MYGYVDKTAVIEGFNFHDDWDYFSDLIKFNDTVAYSIDFISVSFPTSDTLMYFDGDSENGLFLGQHHTYGLVVVAAAPQGLTCKEEKSLSN